MQAKICYLIFMHSCISLISYMQLERIDLAKKEAAEKKRLEDMKREAERKAALEAAEKKAKAAAKKKK